MLDIFKNESVVLIFDEEAPFLFKRGFLIKSGTEQELQTKVHIGNYVDSFLVSMSEENVDLRYYIERQEFYQFQAPGEVYIVNAGVHFLQFRFSFGKIIIRPGEGKLVCEENVDRSGFGETLTGFDVR